MCPGDRAVKMIYETGPCLAHRRGAWVQGVAHICEHRGLHGGVITLEGRESPKHAGASKFSPSTACPGGMPLWATVEVNASHTCSLESVPRLPGGFSYHHPILQRRKLRLRKVERYLGSRGW